MSCFLVAAADFPTPKLPDIGKIADVGILFVLLPGLLVFLIERMLTSRERKLETTEAILWGLAYTLLTHAVWTGFKWVGSIVPTPDLVGLTLSAIGLAFIITFLKNSAIVFRTLRKLGVTNESPWLTIWETAFRVSHAQKNEYVVLHLLDGNRLFGAVEGHSAEQKDGHICLTNAKWLVNGTETPINGMLLLRAEDVKVVEFVPRQERKNV